MNSINLNSFNFLVTYFCICSIIWWLFPFLSLKCKEMSVILALNSRLFVILQGFKDFINEVNTLASLRHPNLCKLLGYHARDGSEQKMLVYERLYHGSLDRLLYGRSEGPPVDWNTRMKLALCAAQGLTFLHEEGPFQVTTTLFCTTYLEF